MQAGYGNCSGSCARSSDAASEYTLALLGRPKSPLVHIAQQIGKDGARKLPSFYCMGCTSLRAIWDLAAARASGDRTESSSTCRLHGWTGDGDTTQTRSEAQWSKPDRRQKGEQASSVVHFNSYIVPGTVRRTAPRSRTEIRTIGCGSAVGRLWVGSRDLGRGIVAPRSSEATTTAVSPGLTC